MKSAQNKIDALLVHAYWLDTKKINKLDIGNEIQLLALKNIVKIYKPKNIVITAGKVHSRHPSMAYLLKREIIKSIPEKYLRNIHTHPSQKTTYGEISQFSIICKNKNWQRLASLGLSLHMPRIKKNFSKVFKNKKVLFLEAESYLTDKDSKTLSIYNKSSEFNLLKKNEVFVTFIEKMPFLGSFSLQLLSIIFINKGNLQPKVVRLFSKLPHFRN